MPRRVAISLRYSRQKKLGTREVTVLDVHFNDAFSPARVHLAKVRSKQMVRSHHGKPDTALAAFALLTLSTSSFHVVVDATTRHPT